MTEQALVEKGIVELNEIIDQLQKNLEALNEKAVPKVQGAVNTTLNELRRARNLIDPHSVITGRAQLAQPFNNAKYISNTLAFLRLAVQQRSQGNVKKLSIWIEKLFRLVFPRLFAGRQLQPNVAWELEQIDKLIQSCYQPVATIVGNLMEIKPENILAVYFQDEYLARPRDPVPYLLIPNYVEGDKPEEWTGVGHEVGHHVYHQVPDLEYEIDVIIAQALREKQVTVNGKKIPVSLAQQRLWFNWLEETFADLYGILTLGAAFVYTQHIIIRNYASSPDLEGLLKGQDKTHPVPLLRGQMGVYIYEQLLQKLLSNDLDALKDQWQEVTSKLVGKSILDPHTPKSSSLADKWSSGKLDYSETIEVMKLVVNTLLTSELRALGCRSLGTLVNFQSDEQNRQVMVTHLQKDEPIKFEDVDARIYVATKRLVIHRKREP